MTGRDVGVRALVGLLNILFFAALGWAWVVWLTEGR